MVMVIICFFLYKNLNLLNNYIINLVFNHFPFAGIQGDVLFKLSIKSNATTGPPEKMERISSDFASRRYALKTNWVLNYLI
jgi:hypothetical protein